MSVTEGPPQEILSPEELGRRAYGAMMTLQENLLATPEFLTAVGKKYFDKDPAAGTSFIKGEYKYSVENERWPKNDKETLRMRINIMSISSPDQQVGMLTLSTDFDRDEKGKPARFRAGHIYVNNQENDFYARNTPDAFDRLPKEFPNLYAAIESPQ